MSTKPKRRSNDKVSEHVQNVQGNTFLPPGAQDPNSPTTTEAAPEAQEDFAVQIGDEQPKEGAEYPAAAGVTDEETHKAQEEAAAEERVARAKAVSSPKRLSDRERQLITIILDLDVVKSAPSITGVDVPVSDLPEYVKDMVLGDRNIFQRGIATPVYGGEPKQIIGLNLREVTMEIYTKGNKTTRGVVKQKKVKVDGSPKAVGGRRSTRYHDGLKLKMIASNPRPVGTMGYYSWLLYKDGMTYSEYMNVKGYPEGNVGWPAEWVSERTQEPFRGPGLNHWTWDLEHGFTGLYKEGENETLEDGSPNPNYWSVNMNPK